MSVDALSNSMVIELTNGKKRKHEFYYGSGYLSSSSRKPDANQIISGLTLLNEGKRPQ
jgi:hypothetical protein